MAARPTLVFIPGLLSDAAAWRPVADRLTGWPQAFADLTAPASITAMAGHVLATVPGRLIPVGHSMGGRVVLEMLRLAPQRIAALALFDTGTHPKKPGEDEKRERLIRLAHNQGMEALIAEWLPPMLHPARLAPHPLYAELRDMVLRMSPEIHERQIRALLGRPDAESDLSRIAVPALVAVGRQDAWSPLAQHEALAAALPRARLEIIEDAGHFAPAEQPDATARMLSDWLASLEAEIDTPVPLPETPLLDRRHALTGYNINKMAMGLMDPANRESFRADENAYLDRFKLTAEEKAAVRARDYREMIRLGGNLFFILKISAIDPTPITRIGADQAGMEHAAFLTDRLGKKING